MSSIAHRYADFSTTSHGGDGPTEEADDALEERRLETFEEGYQAGWADATTALHTEQHGIAAEFAQNIQDMSFTYHEALSKLTGAYRPLMEQIVSRVLPAAAQTSLVGHIVQQLDALVESHVGGEATITVSSNTLGAARKLLAQNDSDVPFNLRADATLSDGQVYLQIGDAERELNLDVVTDGIVDAVNAFFTQTNLETSDD